MKRTVQNVRNRLKAAKQKKFGIKAVKGCCKIFVDGATSRRSGITERECRDIANDFPGAIYTFAPGETCS